MIGGEKAVEGSLSRFGVRCRLTWLGDRLVGPTLSLALPTWAPTPSSHSLMRRRFAPWQTPRGNGDVAAKALAPQATSSPLLVFVSSLSHLLLPLFVLPSVGV